MKKLTVISGKGGTGKTTFVANLAFLAGEAVLADCDVDAPNLHLLMAPDIMRQEDYLGGRLAVKDQNRCTECGICRELCNFKAIDSDNEIIDYRCEGCGLCAARCPEDALRLVKNITGDIFYSTSRTGPMVHARLKIGAENSGRLVSRVREEAENLAEEKGYDLLFIDGSPGIGCPVIASLGGADGALIVSEPTESGISDMKRIIEVTEHFSIPAYMVINKYDINIELTNHIIDYCQENDISILGSVPFDETAVRAMEKGELVVEFAENSRIAAGLKKIWERAEKEFIQKNHTASIDR